jgi:multidrug transporter EmrE-like cation transporter
MKNIALILVSIALNAAAQIFMRFGMLKVGEVEIGASLIKAVPRMITSIFLWLSIVCYGISMVSWMVVLSKVEVSFAYAFLSLGFVLVTILGALFLREHISIQRIVGICVVCCGIILVARS